MSNHTLPITLLDGSMGQELVTRSRRPTTPLWSTQVVLDEPDLVTELHREYIEAGADIITLAAYSATPERLQQHGVGDLFDEIQARALDCARQARAGSDRPVRIAGTLPPLVASYRPDLAPDADVSADHYGRVVAAQQDGVDLFICETMASIAEAKAAATAALQSNKPVWVALSVSDDGTNTLRGGESLTDAVAMLQPMPVEAILINCSWPESSSQAIQHIGPAGKPLGVYANGFESVDALQPGGTVDVLQARTDLDPEAYARHAEHWLSYGARIIGGCCEVGPAHIQRLRQLIDRGV